MTEISFTIPGRIGGKGRHRARIARGKHGQQFVQTYTPTATRNAEAMIRTLAAQAIARKPRLDGPLCLELTIWVNHPASWSKKRKAATVHAIQRVDLDNICKSVGDSCNGILYQDDKQITEIHARRLYTFGTEKAVIKLTELNGAVG